ncbi:hypothetical protein [Lentimicrobium sp.]|uniref:hypothetical protein n=1 Tax=Lentimicrobium sp. TaxID=2034841 RepID=UPI002B21F541|nr:hypothetical protein [Lentimicrobium sp.]
MLIPLSAVEAAYGRSATFTPPKPVNSFIRLILVKTLFTGRKSLLIDKRFQIRDEADIFALKFNIYTMQ